MTRSRWPWSLVSGQTIVSLLVSGLAAVLVLYPIFYLIQAALNVGDPQARPPRNTASPTSAGCSSIRPSSGTPSWWPCWPRSWRWPSGS